MFLFQDMITFDKKLVPPHFATNIILSKVDRLLSI